MRVCMCLFLGDPRYSQVIFWFSRVSEGFPGKRDQRVQYHYKEHISLIHASFWGVAPTSSHTFLAKSERLTPLFSIHLQKCRIHAPYSWTSWGGWCILCSRQLSCFIIMMMIVIFFFVSIVITITISIIVTNIISRTKLSGVACRPGWGGTGEVQWSWKSSSPLLGLIQVELSRVQLKRNCSASWTSRVGACFLDVCPTSFCDDFMLRVVCM